MSKKFEFDAIPSGDYESFCFAVDRETYIKIEGQEPGKRDKNLFNKGLFNIYPDIFFDIKAHRYRVRVEIEVIEENVERVKDDSYWDDDEDDDERG